MDFDPVDCVVFGSSIVSGIGIYGFLGSVAFNSSQTLQQMFAALVLSGLGTALIFSVLLNGGEEEVPWIGRIGCLMVYLGILLIGFAPFAYKPLRMVVMVGLVMFVGGGSLVITSVGVMDEIKSEPYQVPDDPTDILDDGGES